MSPLKLSRTTAGSTEEVQLDAATAKKVEEILDSGVPLEQAFREGMDEVVRKHKKP
jgi:hypothetical protein